MSLTGTILRDSEIFTAEMSGLASIISVFNCKMTYTVPSGFSSMSNHRFEQLTDGSEHLSARFCAYCHSTSTCKVAGRKSRESKAFRERRKWWCDKTQPAVRVLASEVEGGSLPVLWVITELWALCPKLSMGTLLSSYRGSYRDCYVGIDGVTLQVVRHKDNRQ